jgi:SAM-dependent methyltransferase
MDRLLNALHYPVARARAHYYPRYDDALTLFLRMIMRHSKPDALVLDLGCGHYSYATPWRQFCRQVIGMDVTPAIRDNNWVGCRVLGDVYHIPLPPNSVDLIIMRFVMEHLERPLAAMREVARVLRPGGKLVLLTPNRRHYVSLFARLTPSWFHRWYLGRLGWAEEENFPTLYRANTPGELRKVAERAGLRLAELEMYEGPPGYLYGSWFTFLLGVAYERLVNRFRALAGFRISIVAMLQKAV